MILRLHDTMARAKREFVTRRSRAGDDVCLRPDRLQLRPHRQRPAGGGVRRALPPAALPLRAGKRDLRRQRHRRGRQDQPEGRRPRACRSRWSPARYLDAYHADMSALGALPPTIEPRATQTMDAIIAMIGRLVRAQRGLRGRGPRAVQHPGLLRLRQAVGPLDGRHDRRRPGRGRALQAASRRLRAVEALQARRAGVGEPLRPRPARLAHRVLGDDRAGPGPAHRHPRRRQRPDLPPPRERDRAGRLRRRTAALRPLLAAQRLPQHGRGEDVQEPGQRRAGA